MRSQWNSFCVLNSLRHTLTRVPPLSPPPHSSHNGGVQHHLRSDRLVPLRQSTVQTHRTTSSPLRLPLRPLQESQRLLLSLELVVPCKRNYHPFHFLPPQVTHGLSQAHHITAGEDELRTFQSDLTNSGLPVTRGFCSVCSSPLWLKTSREQFKDIIMIPFGSINEQESVAWKPNAELFVENRVEFLNPGVEGVQQVRIKQDS